MVAFKIVTVKSFINHSVFQRIPLYIKELTFCSVGLLTQLSFSSIDPRGPRTKAGLQDIVESFNTSYEKPTESRSKDGKYKIKLESILHRVLKVDFKC